MTKLSIIVPVFNEKKTILEILRRIEKVIIPKVEKEIVIVDDFSIDGTREILKNLQDKYQIVFHHQNLGKGAAVRTGLRYIHGQIVLIQDADLEYSPEDYPKLLEPILRGKASVVYGSRALLRNPYFSFWYFLGGRLVTCLANFLYGVRLTDINAGYKVFKKEILEKIALESNGFEFCEEVTAKLSKKGYQILEVPVKYLPRSFADGKKLSWKDGLFAIVALIKFKFQSNEDSKQKRIYSL